MLKELDTEKLELTTGGSLGHFGGPLALSGLNWLQHALPVLSPLLSSLSGTPPIRPPSSIPDEIKWATTQPVILTPTPADPDVPAPV